MGKGVLFDHVVVNYLDLGTVALVVLVLVDTLEVGVGVVIGLVVVDN